MKISVELFKAIAAAEGDKEKVDTKKEKDALAKLLANNNDSQEEADNILKALGLELNFEKADNNTKTHIRKDNPNVGWKELVEAYYPDLIKACDGQMYGEKGAIRAFQKELCKDENGNLDEDKLKQIIRAADLPAEIKLPDNINGAERQNNTPKAAKYAANTKDIAHGTYIATDGTDGSTASGGTPEEALNNLSKITCKSYESSEKE